ncbi:hypothetical protein ACS0TY_015068 [Phlomoides rotata]
MGEKPHALMICVRFQGHINPFVNLALKLASKGIIVTFVHLEFVHHKLSKAHHANSTNGEVDFFSEARESGFDIRYTTISDGLPLEYDRDAHFVEYSEMLFRDFPARVDEFVGKIIRQCHSINILVTDTLYAWSADIAKKYKLVSVSFWTQPALVFSLLYHLDLLTQNGHFPCKDGVGEEIDYVPGVDSVNTKDVMSYLRKVDPQIVTKIVTAAFKEVKKADLILHNTVDELECKTLGALNKYQPNYAIGPINFCQNILTNKSLVSESECTYWLDSKPPGSVLYVSFGSLVQMSKRVIEEIAYGLLHSGVSFIWVIRSGLVSFDDAKVLPDGFEDAIKERGLIIPWCNQINVLSNPAVGGFMTHCGWNSTVESMWCGVPMICYPITYDQPTNRKLVVDEWKIGVDLCDGKNIDREEVAEKINKFMSGSVLGLKQEANKVKAVLHNAMEVDGSSERNFQHFLHVLKAKIQETASTTNVDIAMFNAKA